MKAAQKTTDRRAITPEEFAAQLGVSKSHVYNLCRRGDVPGARKLGKNWLIPVEAADRLMGEEI